METDNPAPSAMGILDAVIQRRYHDDGRRGDEFAKKLSSALSQYL